MKISTRGWICLFISAIGSALLGSCQTETSSADEERFDTTLEIQLRQDSLGWAYWSQAHQALNRALTGEADSFFQLAAEAYQTVGNATGRFWAQLEQVQIKARKNENLATVDSMLLEMVGLIDRMPSDLSRRWAAVSFQYGQGLKWYGARPYIADSSLAHLGTLISLCEEGEGPLDEELLAQLYFLLGDIHFKAEGNYAKAAYYLEKSLLLSLKEAPSLELSARLLIYAWVKEQAGEYQYAERLQQYTLAVRTHLLGQKHPHVANAWNQLGNCYYEQQAYNSAKTAYNQAYQVMSEISSYPRHELIYLNNLAATLEQLGQDSLLEGYYLQGQKLITQRLSTDPDVFAYNRVLNLQNLAAYYINQGVFEKAEPLLLQAAQIAAKQNQALDLAPATTQLLLAELYLKQGKHSTAMHAIEKAKRLADIRLSDGSMLVLEGMEPGVVMDILTMSAKILHEKPSAEISSHQQTLQEYDLLFRYANQERWQFNLEEDQLHTGASFQQQVHKAVDLSHTLFQQSKDPQFHAQAFSLMELSKSQVLQQEVRKQQAARKAQSRRHMLSLKQAAASTIDQDGAVLTLDQLRKEQSMLQNLISQVHEFGQLETHDPESREEDPVGSPMTLSKLQDACLNARELLISYMIGDSSIWEMSISAAQVQLRSIPLDARFLEQVEQFKAAATQTASGFMETRVCILEEAGYALSQRLLLPVFEHHFGADGTPSRIHIIPDDWLFHFPFELLPTESLGAENYQEFPYLLCKASVNYAFSAGLLSPEQASAKQSALRPQFLSVSTLPESSSGSDIKLPDSFVASNLKEREVTQAKLFAEAADKDILQIFSHGFADETSLDPYLLLHTTDETQGDSLFAYEVARLPLSAELVVLTACDGGRGKLTRGEGSMSLLRSFKMTGTGHLVAGLWKVRIAPLSQILSRFYDAYARGIPPDQALQQAKLAYLENVNPREADPAIWGVLVSFSQLSVNP